MDSKDIIDLSEETNPEIKRVKQLVLQVLAAADRPLTQAEIAERVEKLMADSSEPQS